MIQVFQGEGGTIESLLAHTASLTSTIAKKDQVIGEVIDNLNAVLDTINARTPQLNDLVTRLQQLMSGLAEDRKPIGDAIESLGELTTTTSGLLADVRQPLKQDIAALGTLTKNLNDSEALVEHFIQFMPEKVTTLSRTADYGSWLNFFLCEADGNVTVPGVMSEPFELPLMPMTRERCGS